MKTTRTDILTAGVGLARNGLHLVTARRVAESLGIHHSNVSYYFKTNEGLMNAVANHAIVGGDAMVIARLILERHAVVSGMPLDERSIWIKLAIS